MMKIYNNEIKYLFNHFLYDVIVVVEIIIIKVNK